MNLPNFTSPLNFFILNLDNDRFDPKEIFAKICRILKKNLNKNVFNRFWKLPNLLLDSGNFYEKSSFARSLLPGMEIFVDTC